MVRWSTCVAWPYDVDTVRDHPNPRGGSDRPDAATGPSAFVHVAHAVVTHVATPETRPYGYGVVVEVALDHAPQPATDHGDRCVTSERGRNVRPNVLVVRKGTPTRFVLRPQHRMAAAAVCRAE